MGWMFRLDAANLVGYLTAPKRLRHEGVPPRVTSSQLRSFFQSISRGDGLFSNRDEWLGAIRNMAERGLAGLDRFHARMEAMPVDREGDPAVLLPNGVVESLIAPLRPLFGNFALYALAIGGPKDFGPLMDFTKEAGRSSGPHGLFLIPDSLSSEAPNLVLDPFPGLSVVGFLPDLIPGVVFWLPSGKVHFFNLEDSRRVYEEIYQRWQRGGFLNAARANPVESRSRDAALEAQRGLATLTHKLYWKRSGSAKIVHLSDLHFGNNAGWRAKQSLISQPPGSMEAVDQTANAFSNASRASR